MQICQVIPLSRDRFSLIGQLDPVNTAANRLDRTIPGKRVFGGDGIHANCWLLAAAQVAEQREVRHPEGLEGLDLIGHDRLAAETMHSTRAVAAAAGQLYVLPKKPAALGRLLHIVGQGNGNVDVRNPFREKGLRHRLASYLGKHISKDFGEHSLNEKRYWTSRNIDVPPLYPVSHLVSDRPGEAVLIAFESALKAGSTLDRCQTFWVSRLGVFGFRPGRRNPCFGEISYRRARCRNIGDVSWRRCYPTQDAMVYLGGKRRFFETHLLPLLAGKVIQAGTPSFTNAKILTLRGKNSNF